MSLLASLKSRVTVWRLPDGSSATNRLGEPSKDPVVTQQNLRASFDTMALMQSHDTGPGDEYSGRITMLIERRADVKLNDIIQVTFGENVGTWWQVAGFVADRTTHREGLVHVYNGEIPA